MSTIVLDEKLAVITRLVEMHRGGLLGGEVMPEDALIGVVPDEKMADVITLGMALNYQRNSYALWKSVAETFVDPERKWVFDTQVASSAETESLREALAAHKIALQPNKHRVFVSFRPQNLQLLAVCHGNVLRN